MWHIHASNKEETWMRYCCSKVSDSEMYIPLLWHKGSWLQLVTGETRKSLIRFSIISPSSHDRSFSMFHLFIQAFRGFLKHRHSPKIALRVHLCFSLWISKPVIFCRLINFNAMIRSAPEYLGCTFHQRFTKCLWS